MKKYLPWGLFVLVCAVGLLMLLYSNVFVQNDWDFLGAIIFTGFGYFSWLKLQESLKAKPDA